MSLADRLRGEAERLAPKIAAKRDPAIGRQRLTPRRARIADSMAREGDYLERVQRCLVHLATRHEASVVPPELASLRSGADVRRLAAAAQAAIHRPDLARPEDVAAWALLGPVWTSTGPTPRDVELRRRERELLGTKIPGFFPTPPSVARALVQALALEPGQTVLEPSCGKGDLLEAVLEADVEVGNVVGIEINGTLASLAALRFGVELNASYLLDAGSFQRVSIECGDIMAPETASRPVLLQGFDRVVMNPPFDRGQDEAHVLRALDFLKPGGRLVALMVQHGRVARWNTFAARVNEAQGAVARIDAIPDRSFASAESFRQTGVSVAQAVITLLP